MDRTNIDAGVTNSIIIDDGRSPYRDPNLPLKFNWLDPAQITDTFRIREQRRGICKPIFQGNCNVSPAIAMVQALSDSFVISSIYSDLHLNSLYPILKSKYKCVGTSLSEMATFLLTQGTVHATHFDVPDFCVTTPSCKHLMDPRQDPTITYGELNRELAKNNNIFNSERYFYKAMKISKTEDSHDVNKIETRNHILNIGPVVGFMGFVGGFENSGYNKYNPNFNYVDNKKMGLLSRAQPIAKYEAFSIVGWDWTKPKKKWIIRSSTNPVLTGIEIPVHTFNPREHPGPIWSQRGNEYGGFIKVYPDRDSGNPNDH